VKNKIKNKKFILVGALISVLVLVAIIIGAWLILKDDDKSDTNKETATAAEENSQEESVPTDEIIEEEAEEEAEPVNTTSNEEETVEEASDDEPEPINSFAKARNSQRQAEIGMILAAVSQYIVEPGNSIDDFGVINSCSNPSPIGTGGVDLADQLVNIYLSEMPQDSQGGTDQDTGYTICNTADGKIQIEAPNAEAGEEIIVSR